MIRKVVVLVLIMTWVLLRVVFERDADPMDVLRRAAHDEIGRLHEHHRVADAKHILDVALHVNAIVSVRISELLCCLEALGRDGGGGCLSRRGCTGQDCQQ